MVGLNSWSGSTREKEAGMFKNMMIWQRLALISLTFSLPIAVLLFFVVKGINHDIRFNTLEKYGNEYQRRLEGVLRHVIEHRIAARLASGERLQAARSRVDDALSGLERTDAALGKALDVTDEGLMKRGREHYRPATIRREWEELKAGVRGSSDNGDTVDERHRHLISDIRALIAHIGDTSNLILDPDLDTYYMMDVTLLALPQAQDRLQEVIAFGQGVIGRGAATDEERVPMNVHAAMMKESDLDRINASAKTALNEDINFLGSVASFQQRVPPALNANSTAAAEFIGLTLRLASPDGARVKAEEHIKAGISALDASFELWSVAADELDKLLTVRIKSYRRSLALAVTLTAAAAAVSALLVYLIARSITVPLGRAVEAAGELSRGNLSVEVRGSGRDETGRLLGSIGEMVGNLRAIVDRINEAAGNVARSAGDLSSSSDRIVKSTDGQGQKAAQVATAAEEMSATISEIARNASDVAEAARVANEAATSGGRIVARSIDSMNGIARTARESGEVISALGARSTDIGRVIEVIDDIADQTNLLALNAAIEAARAGDQGRGFAVVADEVRKLAERTMLATKEIGGMIKSIQDGNGKALESMKNEVKAVEEGVSLAGEAGMALKKIVAEVGNVMTLVQQIATAVEQQSASALQMSGDIEKVASSAKETLDGARRSAALSAEMTGFAEMLNGSVAIFSVSESDGKKPLRPGASGGAKGLRPTRALA
jgi:methyl-accepting chemotaxis protein